MVQVGDAHAESIEQLPKLDAQRMLVRAGEHRIDCGVAALARGRRERPAGDAACPPVDKLSGSPLACSVKLDGRDELMVAHVDCADRLLDALGRLGVADAPSVVMVQLRDALGREG